MSTNRQPVYRHYKRTSQAAVRLTDAVTKKSKDIYLGPFNSDASRERYHQVLAEWERNGRRLSDELGKPETAPDRLTITELCRDYWKRRVESYYPEKTKPSIKVMLRRLRAMYGTQPAEDLGPLDLKRLRQSMIDEGLRRTTINKSVVLLRQMFKWAASEEMIPVQVHQALQTVEGLRAGRGDAKESREVLPVPMAHVDAVRPHVADQVWALIQLQLANGARSGELVVLRPIDLDTTGDVWTAEKKRHKTAHHGKRRMLVFGPRAQAILAPFLVGRPVGVYLFSPAEAEHDRRSQGEGQRRPNQAPTRRKTARVIGDHYTPHSYRQAISRACKLAGVPHWHPHQLRHAHATEVRKKFGLEIAQMVLGHAVGSKISELYAEADVEKVKEILRKIG
ncbi:MAG: recombinase XerD [Phycisphaeraceae bacterium]|nr:recombinase XerD [Phycisphaeraceae bacterium]